MSLYSVDVEADGPCPGLFSMVSFGAVRVADDLSDTFYGQVRPISNRADPDTTKFLEKNIPGFSRKAHEKYDHPDDVMQKFAEWIERTNRNGRPIFVSDNLAFDWQFINYYFHAYRGRNPFGFSGRRIGDIHAGLTKDLRASWKHLRVTAHTHNPVDDAKGNAEALLSFRALGLKSL